MAETLDRETAIQLLQKGNVKAFNNLRSQALRNNETLNLKDADLSNLNLASVNLKHVNLQGVNLENTNLAKAVLEHANFHGTNFKNANLSNAFLKGTKLTSLKHAIAIGEETQETRSKQKGFTLNELDHEVYSKPLILVDHEQEIYIQRSCLWMTAQDAFKHWDKTRSRTDHGAHRKTVMIPLLVEMLQEAASRENEFPTAKNILDELKKQYGTKKVYAGVFDQEKEEHRRINPEQGKGRGKES